jgi:endoglucanase
MKTGLSAGFLRWLAPALTVVFLLWLAVPVRVDEARLSAAQLASANLAAPSRSTYSVADLLASHDLKADLAQIRLKHQHAELQRVLAEQRLHQNFFLHGVRSQLYTAWRAPITLKAVNWYGFEYAPFVPGGLDKTSLDSILYTLHSLGFNALRIPFANETVERNPVVQQGVQANPELRGLRSLDIMQKIIERAHEFGIRVILCNSRSEAGRGPEIKTGLWYTADYPESAWFNDWITLVRRFRADSAFVGADLRNEPHIIGKVFDINAYFVHGPLWGAFHGTYYHDRDWRYAAETLGNALVSVNPKLLIIVEGVQMYLDPYKNVLTGGLWGGDLVGVQYDPVELSHQSQLVYSVHEYGPHMWQGNWFNPHTTYASLSKRWDKLWGYLLTASHQLQAPIFVGEFGTCHEFWACVSNNLGWKQGFWFKSFVQYLHAHPQVGWAYWALNPDGPFHPHDVDFYSVTSLDWKHYYPLIRYGLAPLLGEPNGLWNQVPKAPTLTAEPGCPPAGSCSRLPQLAAELSTNPALPRSPPRPSGVQVAQNVSYIPTTDNIHLGDLYLPQGQGNSLRPAVVVVHGGQFVGGSKGQIGTTRLARALAGHGYVAFDVNYRLVSQGGGFPQSILDIKDAVDFLSTHATQYDIDPKKIGIAGAGAGGYLAMMAGYITNAGAYAPPHYPGPQARAAAVVSLFAPIELSKITDPAEQQILSWYFGGTNAAIPNTYLQGSPGTYADTGVSTMLVSGLGDQSVPFTEDFALYKWLRQRSISSQLVDLPGSPHALTDLGWQTRHTLSRQIISFLDGVFYKPPPPKDQSSG